MIKVVAENRKARFEYFIEDCFECGIVLKGTEVKGVRSSGVSLKEAWCTIEDNELYIKQMHIKPYEMGMAYEVRKLSDGNRPRKLLVHKQQIEVLKRGLTREGYTIVPTKVYFKGDKLKVEVALAKGKKLYDKREVAAARDVKREIDRAIKERY